jgi:Ran GTPase-activating protein (RanGAP) involved in mRNA processing and transport
MFEFHLCSNNICIAGATAIASYLIKVQRLQVLKLSANCIGDEGARAMAEVIIADFI